MTRHCVAVCDATLRFSSQNRNNSKVATNKVLPIMTQLHVSRFALLTDKEEAANQTVHNLQLSIT